MRALTAYLKTLCWSCWTCCFGNSACRGRNGLFRYYSIPSKILEHSTVRLESDRWEAVGNCFGIPSIPNRRGKSADGFGAMALAGFLAHRKDPSLEER
jgi:hypothetical protein